MARSNRMYLGWAEQARKEATELLDKARCHKGLPEEKTYAGQAAFATKNYHLWLQMAADIAEENRARLEKIMGETQ